MKSLVLSRGARLACAFTLTTLALACWAATPSFASNFADRFGADKKLNLTSPGTPHAAAGSLSGTIVRTLIALMVVIAVIYGITWLLRQSRGARNVATGEGLVQIASLPLGPNRSVSLVRVGSELHMLGVAEHGISAIRVFSEEEAYELGIPFDPEDIAASRRGGAAVAQRTLETLRRLTYR